MEESQLITSVTAMVRRYSITNGTTRARVLRIALKYLADLRLAAWEAGLEVVVARVGILELVLGLVQGTNTAEGVAVSC